MTIVNRTPERAKELADLINKHTSAKAEGVKWEPSHKIPEGTDILINATSIGLGDPEAKPDIDYSTITGNMAVSDVVFNPRITKFLQGAQSQGAKAVDGLGMLACQGALNFTLWTGVEAPLDVMVQTLEDEFK